MMISPVIFCTIVLGIGSVRQAAKVGKVGGLALVYFVVMSTVALTIGLVVGNILHPGAGPAPHRRRRGRRRQAQAGEAGGTDRSSCSSIIPTTLVSPLTSASRAADAARGAARRVRASRRWAGPGQPVLRGVEHFERLVFRVLSMIMWAAPIGAFGAMAAVVGATGVDALKSLGDDDARLLRHLLRCSSSSCSARCCGW